MRFIVCGLTFLLVFATAAAAQVSSSLRVANVNQGIYMVSGGGGNVAISAGVDGFLVVDTPLPQFGGQLRDAIRSLGYGEPSYIIITHDHPDHIGANGEFGKDTKLLMHAVTASRVAERGERRLADETFEDPFTIEFNEEPVQVFIYPNAHSAVDVVVYFSESKVVAVGDLFFNRNFPVMDIPAGGNVEGLAFALTDVLESIDEKSLVIPGHGPYASYGELEAYRDMVVATTRIVLERKAAGVDDAINMGNGFPDEFRKFDSKDVPYEQWISYILQSAKE